MNNEQKERMIKLRQIQKEKNKDLKTANAKNDISTNVVDFEKRYRFADKEEALKINNILDQLSFFMPCRIDFAELPIRKSPCIEELEWNKTWLCFLCGAKEYLDIFISGPLESFIKNYDDWDYYSPYLLILNDDFNRFIYIDDNKNIIESCLKIKISV